MSIQDSSAEPYKYKFPELKAYYSGNKCSQEFYPGTLTVKISDEDLWEQASLRLQSKFVNKDRRLNPVNLNASFDEAYDRNQTNTGSFDAIGRTNMDTGFLRPRSQSIYAPRFWTEQ